MTEEEQINAAIAASMGDHKEPSPTQIIGKERADLASGPNTTSIQFRLPEGKRIVKKFAKDDSILALFQHLKAVVPELASKPFEIVFHRELLSAKLDATLQEINLIGASVNVDFA